MNNDFYVYEWFNTETNEVFYVGKGRGKRYLDKKHRNKLFLDYIESNKVSVRKIKENLTEEEAFCFEEKITEKYKLQGMCQCCLAKGGTGGVSSVWTPAFREYWSKYNPMKAEEQKERMRKSNPMYNSETALKSGAHHKRAVVIDGKFFLGVIDAAKTFGVTDYTVSNWCKRGYNTKGKPCRYADEEQKKYTLPKLGKGVLIDGKDYYPTVKQAAFALGSKDSSPLCKALKSKKLYKGHKCEYANQQPSEENSQCVSSKVQRLMGEEGNQ